MNTGKSENDTLMEWEADLSYAAVKGIEIPSENQVKGGKFVFSFEIRSPKPDTICYALIWHNSSYAWPEVGFEDKTGENFYGGINTDTTTVFKEIYVSSEKTEVTDSFKIVGNPRNERIYYGKKNLYISPGHVEIEKTIQKIKSIKEWYEQVKVKARKERRSIQRQLFLDALWDINYNTDKESVMNRRERRNPRMGIYEMILVVMPKQILRNYPEESKNLGVKNKNGKYENIFYFWKKNKDKDVLVHSIKPKIRVWAKYDPKTGIFIDTTVFKDFGKQFWSRQCNASEEQYRKAHFVQYLHYLNPQFPIHNISDIENTLDSSFTPEDYKRNLRKAQKIKSRINASNTCLPCQTVGTDDSINGWVMYNPGSAKYKPQKQNVGLMGRIGFTYGKWTAKIKFSPILNKHRIWNGLTLAFWLLSPENIYFNNRRECCCGKGYIPKSEPDEESSFRKSVKQLSYSEIDFEILKESKYWPPTSYPGKQVPDKGNDKENEIMVCCTNWDMACMDPPEFFWGAKEWNIGGTNFVAHRWNPWYKAVTSKIPVDHDEIFSKEYYYFQIEWLPDKIFWRIGPEKNKLRTICVMNDHFTSIPDNQMFPIITQEWHHQDWWPTAPYKQNAIPCPSQNLKCIIYELTVE
ncbi:MAG: hypothetical protein N3F09_07190 [Bacteroidia bacterium]|nr:hypothetical protein [Bacteroidia bacterium]